MRLALYMVITYTLYFYCVSVTTAIDETTISTQISSNYILEEIRARRDLLKEFNNRLKNQVLRHQGQAEDRHGQNLSSMFHALASAAQCGTGPITNAWQETLDFDKKFRTASAGFSNGVFTAPRNGFYYFSACFLCGQGSACDVRMLYQGSPVAAMGNRWNGNGNNKRYTMICQSIAQFMVSSGLDPVKFKFAKQSYYTILNKNCPIYTNRRETFSLEETAGGGSPNNCKTDRGYSYSTFSGFSLARKL